MENTPQATAPAAPIILVTTAHPSFAEHPGPSGETTHPMLGRLIQPRHFSSIEQTGAAGIPWAADNDCFQGLDADAFVAMLNRIEGVPGCLFVTVPDVVGDAAETARQFDAWAPELERRGLPVALVLQDGIDEVGAWLDATWHRLSAVFIGGTDDFKLGPLAAGLAREAKRRGLWVHWGRVNTKGRIAHIAETGAADSFDGSSWAIYRKAIANKRTGERKLEQGLRWCAETAKAAARIAPQPALFDGRVVPAVAGASPETNTDERCNVVHMENTPHIAISRAEAHARAMGHVHGYGSREAREARADAADLRDEAWTEQVADPPDARDREATAAYRKASAELAILERYDELRRYRYGDYGGGQRWAELTRRRYKLSDLAKVAPDVTGEPTRHELVEAFKRVGLPKLRRLLRDEYRLGRSRASRTSVKCWQHVAAELDLRVDNPPRRDA